jgi:hypothetical protein
MKHDRGMYHQLSQVLLFSYLLLSVTVPLNAKEIDSKKGAELNLQINADNNDVVEGSNGSFYLSSFDGALFGHYYWNTGVSMSSFYRWVTTDIKQGETINTATLTLYLKQDSANNKEGISTKFYGISEDNTPVFSTEDKPSLRPITKSKVVKNNWADDGTEDEKNHAATSISIDVTNIVQEIVARDGFTEGSAIAIAHINNNSWNAYAMTHEFSRSPDYAPKLTIHYGNKKQCDPINHSTDTTKNCSFKTAKVSQ